MKKLITLVYSFLSFVILYAQECDPASIMSIKGKWINGEDNIVSPEPSFPRSLYKELNKRIDKIATLFQKAYPDPLGIEAKWYRSVRGYSLIPNGPVPYQFNSLYKGWYCNKNVNKLMLGSETGTWAYVHVNSFGWLMADQWDKLIVPINGTTAYLLSKKIGEWKGFPLYEASGSQGKCSMVLITRKNQLPYTPVTRLQFLSAMKTKLTEDKRIQLDFQIKIPVRSEAEEELARQKGAEAYTRSYRPERKEQARMNYLKFYKTDVQRRQENIAIMEKYFDDRIKRFDDAWKALDDEQLQAPAIVNSDYTDLFKGFTTEEDGGRMAVLLNHDYFNTRLPRYVPQFMVLYWEWDGNKAAQNFRKHIEEDFPIEELRSLIDK